MGKFRIAYIEHEPEQLTYHVKEAMEAADAEVDPFPTVERFEEAMKRRSWYDLVVTDTHFLEPGEVHKGKTISGQYRLMDVLRIVRKHASNQNIWIIALTRFSSALLQKYHEDLAMLDDIWAKPADRNYLTWQILRLKDKKRLKNPNHALVETLRRVTANSDLIWSTQLSEMLTRYREERNERDQMEAVREGLIGMTEGFSKSSVMSSILRSLIAMEPYNIAAKQETWGHLRHVANVYWLGYLILNHPSVDIVAMGHSIFSQVSLSDSKTALENVNQAWLLAGMLHDLGLFGEALPKLLRGAKSLTQAYDLGALSGTVKRGGGKDPITGDLEDFGLDALDQLRDTLKQLADTGPRGVGAWLGTVARHLSWLEHGSLSAAVLMKRLASVAEPFVVEVAARAAAVHNFPALVKRVQEISVPKVYAADSPIAALLLFCDQIEVWDRETGQESIYSTSDLQSMELSEIVSTDDALLFKIKYWPYRYAQPDGERLGRLEVKLKEILREQVFENLSHINWAKSPFPVLKVETSLGGKELVKWSSDGSS